MAKSSVAPLERCKILFQTGKLHSAGIIPTLRSIILGEGVKGLFRGNGASVLRIIPYSSIHFGLYENYRRMIIDFNYGHRNNHHGVSPVVDLLAGSASGATAVLVTYPLDLVRTRLAYITEAGSSKSARKGVLSAAQMASGIGAKLPGVTTTAAGELLTGRIAPLPTQPSTNPLKRSLHGLRPADPHNTIRGVLSSTVRQEGVRGLYHGMGASMYGILPYAGLKFFVYQHLKQAYLAMRGAGAVIGGDGAVGPPTPRLPVPMMLSCGAVAGLIAQSATYPLDVVRRRLQVEGLKRREPPVALGAPHFPNDRLPHSTPAALVAIIRRQGWRALYSGLSINYMKVVPSTAIGFTLYDYLKSALDLPTHL